MNKKFFMQQHIDEFFNVSGIKKVDLDLSEVLSFVARIWDADTPNGKPYFEKPWISLTLREDIAIDHTVPYVQKSKEGFIEVYREEK